MHPFIRYACYLLLFCAALPAADDNTQITIEEGRVYRRVNGEPVTGREVLDLLLEQKWADCLQTFIDYSIWSDEIKAQKAEVSDAEIDAELNALLKNYADRIKVNPAELKLETLSKELPGGMAELRRQTRLNLGMLRILQRERKLSPDAHTWERGFKELVTDRVEKLMSQVGVVTDPQKLGTGEAVRIGVKSYSRGELRQFSLDRLAQLTLAELKSKLEVLTLEKLAMGALKERKLELTPDALEFHFKYLCHKLEFEQGVPGRYAMGQHLAGLGLTVEKFMADRIFKADAALTLAAKMPIHGKEMRAEFANHPERYKRNEKLIANIFISVLDPDGRPYASSWQAPGHDGLNQFVAKRRDEQFAAYKPQIESVISDAQKDFEAAVKKYSQDNKSREVGGQIGRIGKDTVMVTPYDNAIRDAAIKLKPGEISPPVRSACGWHLLKCLEQQDVTYEEAEPRVFINLIHEAKQKLKDTLMKTAKIEEN